MTVARRLLREPIGPALLFFALGALFLGEYLQPTPDHYLGGGDMVGQWLQILRLARSEILAGRWPLWNPYLAAGLPLQANPQLGLFYPPYWVFWLTSIEQGVAWIGAFHLGWMGLGAYWFMRRLGLSPIGAVCAGLIMGFNGFMTVHVAEGHPAFLSSVAWLPWMLWAHLRAVQIGTWRSAAWLGVALAGAIVAGNPASAMLALFCLGLWVTFELLLPDSGHTRWGPLKPFAVAGVVAVGLAAVQLLPTLEYLALSARSATSYAFASQYSLPAAHLISLILPDFFGEPVRLGYWGEFPHIEYLYYPGITAMAAATILWRGRPAEPRMAKWLLIGGFGLLVALGPVGGLHWLLYEVFPLIRYVRVPARFMLLAVLALAWLCGAAVDRWANEPERSVHGRTAWAVSVAALGGLAVAAFLFYTLRPAEDARAYHIGSELMRAGALVFVTGLVVFWRPAQHPAAAGAVIVVVLLADLWGYGQRQLHFTAATADPAWALAQASVSADTPYPKRVLPWGLKLEQQNRGQDVGLASANAYDPLLLERSQRFFDSVADPRATTFDLLATQWLLSPDNGAWLADDAFPSQATATGFGVYRRPTALPRAWVAPVSRNVPDLDAALAVIHGGGFDGRALALLEQAECAPGTGGDAVITGYDPTHITLAAQGTGVLVLSEAWYPGWTATIDGQPATVLIADGMLRGVCLSGAGTQRVVRFEFLPTWFCVGAGSTAVTMAVGLWQVALVWRRRRTSVETKQ